MSTRFDGDQTDRKIGAHRYIYGAEVNFYDVCMKYINAPGDGSHYIHIYCDHLLWGDKTTTGGPTIQLDDAAVNSPAASGYVHIYARTLWKDIPANNLTWKFKRSKPSAALFSIDFFFENEYGRAKFATSNGDDLRFTRTFGLRQSIDDKDNAGVSLSVMVYPDQSLSSWQPIPELYTLQMRRPVYHRAVDDRAAFDESPSRYLLLLLQTMLATAREKMTGSDADQLEAIEYLRFIVRCSRYSQDQSQLCSDARALLVLLELPRRYPKPEAWHTSTGPASKFRVPDLVMTSYLDNVQRWNSLIDQLTDSRNSIARFESLQDEQRKACLVTLEAIAITAPSAIDNTLNASNAIAALYAADRTKLELQAKKTDLESAKDAFQRSFRDFTEAQKKDLIMAIFTDVLAISVTLVTAVATSGAGATLTQGNFGKILQDVNATVTKWERLKAIVTTLAEKIPALAISLETNISSFERNKNLSSTFGKENPQEQVQILQSKVAAGPVDQMRIIEQWEEFKLDVDTAFFEMEKALGSDPAAGSYAKEPWTATTTALRAYKNEMNKCAVRGQAILNQQRVVDQAVQTYYSGRAISKAFEERERKIRTMKNDLSIGQKDSERETQQQALTQLDYELSRAKVSAATSFDQAIVSYLYAAGRKDWPKLNYATDLETLITMKQTADTQFKNLNDMQRDPVYTTEDRAVFAEDWKAEFAFDRHIPFTIPCDLGLFNEWCRTRIHEPLVRIWYTDEADPQKQIELLDADYAVQLGPQFMDNNSSGELLQYWIMPFRVYKVTGKGPDPARRSVWDRGTYILPTLACTGTISFPKPSPPTDPQPTEQEKAQYAAALKRESLLERISKVELTLICEGVHR